MIYEGNELKKKFHCYIIKGMRICLDESLNVAERFSNQVLRFYCI
jgi:hypothetical protein